VKHYASPKFRVAYEALPPQVRQLADANYARADIAAHDVADMDPDAEVQPLAAGRAVPFVQGGRRDRAYHETSSALSCGHSSSQTERSARLLFMDSRPGTFG
jgi:hypothetical protein